MNTPAGDMIQNLRRQNAELKERLRKVRQLACIYRGTPEFDAIIALIPPEERSPHEDRD